MIQVSDHALLRFLERAGGIDPEPLRAQLQASLERANAAARSVGMARYSILADGLVYVVVEGVVVTIMADEGGPRGRVVRSDRR